MLETHIKRKEILCKRRREAIWLHLLFQIKYLQGKYYGNNICLYMLIAYGKAFFI